MSSGVDVAATVALFNALYTAGYCGLAATVVFFYDAFVTFDREVSCVWTAKWTGGSYLFIANKWISMLYYVVALVTSATFPSDKVCVLHDCSSFVIAQEAIQILQFFPGAIFSALRAFVLSKSKLVGILVLALSLAPVGANMVKFGYQVSGENMSPFGCLGTDNETEAVSNSGVYISRVPLIVADILLVYITWANTSSRSALIGLNLDKRLSLSDILFRNGTIYFVILSVLNILHLVLSVTATASNALGSYVTYFTTPITAILVSRFLLDLQEANQDVVKLDADDPLHTLRDPYATPSFISPLGAFINPDVPVLTDNGLDSHFDWDKEEGFGTWQAESPGAASSSSSYA